MYTCQEIKMITLNKTNNIVSKISFFFVKATDSGGKSSQTIVEVTVIPGPNTRSPVFQETTYHVTISEGAPINSSVATISVSLI